MGNAVEVATLKTINMTQTEIKFIEDHIINFESVKLGFARNIGHDVLAGYEKMYQKYIDANFFLTYWCGSCVLDMLQRLQVYYENTINAANETQAKLIIETIEEPVEYVQSPTKKARKKKA